jgi:hypothetical protein
LLTLEVYYMLIFKIFGRTFILLVNIRQHFHVPVILYMPSHPKLLKRILLVLITHGYYMTDYLNLSK